MNEKIQEIKKENYIICVYFILLFIYLYANSIEIKYINYKNIEDKENYRILLYVVFGISLIISLYYTIESIKDIKNYTNQEIKDLKELSSLASVLIVIATIIYLYIIYKDNNINLEISP